jgi:hypothetical protein
MFDTIRDNGHCRLVFKAVKYYLIQIETYVTLRADQLPFAAMQRPWLDRVERGCTPSPGAYLEVKCRIVSV